jgi:RNA polymerase sigma-70 factor (ECF subfamily)
MEQEARQRIMAWVVSEVLPHEAQVRSWLRRMIAPDDIEEIIQEAYFRISCLGDIAHIQNGRAYFFTTARMLVLERIRRSRIVRLDALTEIEASNIMSSEPSPERSIAGRRELARVRRLIEALPDRCRQIFELRKIEGLSQREVARRMEVPEHTVENDVARGLKLILHALAEGEQRAEEAFSNAREDERTRDLRRDQ